MPDAVAPLNQQVHPPLSPFTPLSSPVVTIATAQLFGTSLWFSAHSAAPDLM